jgi:myo-inositol-1(or 4)-monophosphatase
MANLPTHTIQALLEAALNIAQKSGAILKKYWGKFQTVSCKNNPMDLVTEADKASEKIILKFLKKNYPAHSVLSEESGWNDVKDSEYLWIVDPLDGTTNFTHQYPMVSVSIGLLYQQIPILGVVYNPILKELFYCSKNCGAFFNEKKIKVSSNKSLGSSLLASGFPYDRQKNKDNNYCEFCLLTHLTQGVRRGGSAALDLAYVAAGRFDGYWERGIKSWDVAAGMMLVQEAGGLVTTYEGSYFKIDSEMIMATNGHIHSALSNKILEARTFIKENVN